jgi:hypothetical protein
LLIKRFKEWRETEEAPWKCQVTDNDTAKEVNENFSAFVRAQLVFVCLNFKVNRIYLSLKLCDFDGWILMRLLVKFSWSLFVEFLRIIKGSWRWIGWDRLMEKEEIGIEKRWMEEVGRGVVMKKVLGELK